MIEEFLPDELPMIEALVMKDGIKSFTDGRFGGALFIDKNQEPEASFNFFMGIGPNLKNMIGEGAEMLGAFLHKFVLDDEHLAGYSSPNYCRAKTNQLEQISLLNLVKNPFPCLSIYPKYQLKDY